MNFEAVRAYFKPVSSAELDELVRKHACEQPEQSIYLEEVGLREVALRVTERLKARADGHAASPKVAVL